METWLDKSQTKTNEPVTLKVKITGRGNLKLLDAPIINVSTDIEKYDPKNSDNITKQGDQITGSRTFEFLLIPRHPGEQKIPSFPYTYFDIEKKNYVMLKSPEFTIMAEKGDDLQSTYAAGVSKEDVKLLGEDIRFIKSGNITIHRKGEKFTGSASFFVLMASPVIAFIGFLIYLKRREKILGNVTLVRNRKAQKIARKRLTDAKKFLDEKKKEEFYTEISRALWGYIADKLGIPPSDLSIDLVRSSLENRKTDGEMITRFITTIEMCEFVRFAPATNSVQMDQVYKETVELISTIEEQLR